MSDRIRRVPAGGIDVGASGGDAGVALAAQLQRLFDRSGDLGQADAVVRPAAAEVLDLDADRRVGSSSRLHGEPLGASDVSPRFGEPWRADLGLGK